MHNIVRPLALAAFCLSLTSVAVAQSPEATPRPSQTGAETAVVNISPLRVDMPSSAESEQMLLRNDSNVPLTVQVRLFAWSQSEDKDAYAPSQDFLVSPSIVTIGPRATQTLHIVPNSQRDSNIERNYRVVVDQLQANKTQMAGVAQTRLRMTIPLFSGGEKASKPALSYVIKDKHLYITNTGSRTARLIPIKMDTVAVASGVVLLENTPRYVLPQSTMSVALPTFYICGDYPVKISGAIDRTPFHADAPQICA